MSSINVALIVQKLEILWQVQHVRSTILITIQRRSTEVVSFLVLSDITLQMIPNPLTNCWLLIGWLSSTAKRWSKVKKEFFHRYSVIRRKIIIPSVLKEKMRIVTKCNNPHLEGINRFLKVELLDEFYFIEPVGWSRINETNKNKHSVN